ncbi:MAG TPA: OsmC family protein [Chloroflexota bacterium]
MDGGDGLPGPVGRWAPPRAGRRTPEEGGAERGPRPMELLLPALGRCSGMDVINVLRKQRQAVTGYQAPVRGARAVLRPRAFARIVVEQMVWRRQGPWSGWADEC